MHRVMPSIGGAIQKATHMYMLYSEHPKIIPESQDGEGGVNVWGRLGNRHILKLDDDGAN